MPKSILYAGAGDFAPDGTIDVSGNTVTWARGDGNLRGPGFAVDRWILDPSASSDWNGVPVLWYVRSKLGRGDAGLKITRARDYTYAAPLDGGFVGGIDERYVAFRLDLATHEVVLEQSASPATGWAEVRRYPMPMGIAADDTPDMVHVLYGVAAGPVVAFVPQTGAPAPAPAPTPPPVAPAPAPVTPPATPAPAAQAPLTATPRDVTGRAVVGRVTQWVSSDPGIATVDASGRVTPRKVGTCLIGGRVSRKDGRVVTAWCTFTVSP